MFTLKGKEQVEIQENLFLNFLSCLKIATFDYKKLGMPIQIEIQDTHAQLLIEFYVQRLKVLRDEILERERETKEINSTIQKLKKKYNNSGKQEIVNNVVSVDTPYSDKWPWVKKVSFVLENSFQPLTTNEIVDVLTEYEPSFLFERKRAIASISSILSSKWGADKEFLRVESESGDFAYVINKPEQHKSENELSTEREANNQ